MRPLPCLCFQYAGIPHPARAEGSHGDTRGRPYPGRIPRHWTVGGIAPGGGADGEGAHAPLPPRRYSPRSSVWGESEEGAGVWARSPGYDFPWASSSWGGGCRHIGSRDRGGGTCPPPRLPLPQGRYLPRSSVWGEPEEKTGVWVGDAGIFRLPLPRGDTPHGPVSGASLKRELVCGWGMPAYSVCPSPEAIPPTVQ